MRKHAYIVFILLLTHSLGLLGQRVQTLMSGTKGAKYWVNGTTGMKYYWTVSKGNAIVSSAVNGDTSKISVDWNAKSGNYKLSVYGETPQGCVSQIKELNIHLTPGNGPQFDSIVYICKGDSFTYNAGAGFASYLWNNKSTGQYMTKTDSGRVLVVVTDTIGNIMSGQSQLVLHPIPKINLGHDTVVCGNQSVLLDAGRFASIFTWSTGANTQIIAVTPPADVSDQYWVIAENEYGCRSTDTIKLFNCDTKQYNNRIPTAFTPNGDGHNDFWELPEAILYPNMSVEVYDRWGRIVFKANNGYTKPWDGTDLSGNKLPIDAYYYIINLKVGKGEAIGTVTILL